MEMLNLGGNYYSIFDIKVCSYDIIGWKHTMGGQDCCQIVFF
jgi:hypothetical protein